MPEFVLTELPPPIDLEQDLGVSRQTAAKYLDELADAGFLKKEKKGKYNYYINEPLFELFLKH